MQHNMKKQIIRHTLLIVGFALFACRSSVDALPLEFHVGSVQTATNITGYAGDGPGLCNRMTSPFGGGGMSAIFMQREDDGKDYTYLAGEMKSSSNTIFLVVICTITNVSSLDTIFNPMDINVGNGLSWAALGVGSDHTPFFKTKAGWEKMREVRKSKAADTIRSKDDIEFVFVFPVPKGSSAWNLTYKGKIVSELKESAK